MTGLRPPAKSTEAESSINKILTETTMSRGVIFAKNTGTLVRLSGIASWNKRVADNHGQAFQCTNKELGRRSSLGMRPSLRNK